MKDVPHCQGSQVLRLAKPALIFALILFPGLIWAAAPDIVRFLNTKEDSIRFGYYYALIAAVMEKTKSEFGPYEFRPFTQEMSSKRLNMEALKGERINLLWSDAGHIELDLDMIAIPIPLDKGLLGHRLLLIRRQDQARFRAIKTLEDFKKLTVGQGYNWGDNKVYRFNGIEVIESDHYQNLFTMLMAGRFDYFARGVNEAGFELDAMKDRYPDLWLEETIEVEYTMCVFFYVSKNHPRLATRIRRGLETMIGDGSFDSLFFKYYRPALARAKLGQRRIFRLENPYLPGNIPLERKELWLNKRDF